MAPVIVDDKSPHCIPFILSCLEQHRANNAGKSPIPPFFLGLNGVQGAGKTTLVSTLCETLRSSPHNLPTVVLSIDDLYLPHAQQVSLAQSHLDNPLVQHRGQPSTHDLQLGISIFTSLSNRKPTRIPVYDKSAFGGQGDRADESTWLEINQPGEPSVDVVVFEGWCVGFRALPEEELENNWKNAKKTFEEASASKQETDHLYNGQLGRLRLEDVRFVNEALKEYDALTNMLDAFVHIDTEDLQYVYQWRLEQEAALRAAKGTGMTDDHVIKFVNGYYPAYELYTNTLRRGIFHGAPKAGNQLRLIIGRDRRVKEVQAL